MPSLPAQLNLILGVIGRRRFYLALVMLVSAALFEVTVAGLFFPYLDLLLNPEKASSHRVSSFVIDAFSLSSTDQFLRLFGAVLIGLVIASALVGSLSKVFITRYVWNAYVVLTRRMYLIYLLKPYLQWRAENSDALAKNVISEVSTFCNGLLVPVAEFLTRATVLVVWAALLVMVNPVVAAAAVGVMGALYLSIYGVLRRRLGRMSDQRFQMQEELFEYVSSSFRNVKDIKLSRTEGMFTDKVEAPARLYSTLNARIGIIAQLPRYAIEALLFLVAVLVLLSLVGTGKLTEVIPVLSLYTIAGFRMLPHMQNLFAASARIKYNIKALDVVAQQLLLETSEKREIPSARLEAFQNLRAQNLSFRFPGADHYVFAHIDFEINAGEVVFIQGKSGSGKSTLGELLLGLLPPTEGVITCNGKRLEPDVVLTNRINAGYLSQESALFGGSLQNNISLYREPTAADDRRDPENHLRRVVQAACADEIADTLGEGIDSWIMEGGKNLSAGQRQRVGLARALYQTPDLLILDEATNALDPATERQVLANIRDLGVAVVIITHQDALYSKGDIAYDFIPDQTDIGVASKIQRRTPSGAGSTSAEGA